MLLAEDLLLLLTDDESGRLLLGTAETDAGLGGAQLIELTLAGRIDLAGEGEGRKGRLVVRSADRFDEPLLDEALDVVTAHQGKKPDAVLKPLGKRLRDRLYTRLREQGVLREERGKVLGIVPTRRWPAVDQAYERQLRTQVEQTLLLGLAPGDRIAALVSLLYALRVLPKVVPPKQHGVSRRDLERRAKAVAEGDWGSAAVRKAVDAMAAATMAAVTAATTAATVSSS